MKAAQTTRNLYGYLNWRITFKPEHMLIRHTFQLDQALFPLPIDSNNDADGNTTATNDTSSANNDTSREINDTSRAVNNTFTLENDTSSKDDLTLEKIPSEYWRRLEKNYNLFGTGEAKQILPKLRPELVPTEKGMDWSLTNLGDVRVGGEESPFVVGDIKVSKDCGNCAESDGLCYCEKNCEYIIH